MDKPDQGTNLGGASRPTAPEGDRRPRRSREDATVETKVQTPDGLMVAIRPLVREDRPALFSIFADVVARGDGFPHEPPLTEDAFVSTWIDPVTMTLVARIVAEGSSDSGETVGAYYLKPNFIGRAAHVANAGYAVSAAHRGRGIGRLLVQDSVFRAPILGFDAIQFNLVFESNPARALYEELGWRVIGRLPRAVEGEDCLIYWRAV